MGRRRGTSKSDAMPAETPPTTTAATNEATTPPPPAPAPVRRNSSRRSKSNATESRTESKPAARAEALSTKPECQRSASKRGGGKQSPWADPTPAQIERLILDSRRPVRIELELLDPAHQQHSARLPVLECSVNSWQELIQIEHLVEALQRPTRRNESIGRDVEETLDCIRIASSQVAWKLAPSAVDSAHRYTTSLKLRLSSLGMSVRSTVGEHVVVELPTTGAATKCSLVINAIVIKPLQIEPDADASVTIQRYSLPPFQPVLDPLAHLHHPSLIPMVTDMLADHKATGRVHVVILRGIPGSGKSSLGRDIIAIARARGARTVVCSGDSYFETPRGYNFDSKLLTKAHEAARTKFESSIKTKFAAIVVLDNTNTQRWEYEAAEQIAARHGCRLHLLELRCPDLPTCNRMAQRNSHGVGVAKVAAMFLRWQPDARAVVFRPHFQDPLVLANPVTRNPINHHVAYVGLFLDAAARTRLLECVKPRHRNVIAEHVTLFFRPTTQYIRQVPIGKRYTIRVTHVVEDAKGQAVEAEIDDELHVKGANEVDHITISTADGVNAYYSNDLLADAAATRSVVQELELEVTLGIALMGQGSNKVVTLASPFAYELDQQKDESGEREDANHLVVIDVDEAALRSGPSSVEVGIQRSEVLRHSIGPNTSTQRVIAVTKSSSASQLTEQQALLLVKEVLISSNSIWASRILVLEHGESLSTRLREAGALDEATKRLTVLTTRGDSASVSVEGLGIPVSVKLLPVSDASPLAPLAPASDASLTKALDELGVSPTEVACYQTQVAIALTEQALSACGFSTARVKRVDSALWSIASPVIDLMAMVELTDCSVDELQRALVDQGVKEVVVDGDDGASTLYFALPLRVASTQIVRWTIPKGRESVEVHRIQEMTRRVRDTLSLEQADVFPRVASLLGAVLQRRLKGEASSATLQLLSERLVLAFMNEHSPVDAMRTEGTLSMDPVVLWATISQCFEWLAAWPVERVAAELHLVVGHGTLPVVAERVVVAIQSACDAISQSVEGGETSGVVYGRMVVAVVGSHNSDVQRRQVCEDSAAASALRTLRHCDRMNRLTRSEAGVNPSRELVFCEPLGVVSGWMEITATGPQ